MAGIWILITKLKFLSCFNRDSALTDAWVNIQKAATNEYPHTEICFESRKGTACRDVFDFVTKVVCFLVHRISIFFGTLSTR